MPEGGCFAFIVLQLLVVLLMLALRLVEYAGTIMLDLHATADGLSSCASADADASSSCALALSMPE